MKKHVTLLLLFSICFMLFSGCSTKKEIPAVSITDVVSIAQLDTTLDNPITLVESYSLLKNKRLDVSADTTGWEELENDHTFNYYGRITENGNAMITIGRKSKGLVGIDFSDVTETPSPERSLDRFIQAYNVLGDRLGEPQIHNVDVVYSPDENVPISQLESYLNGHDSSHSYYVEWKMQDGDYIGIDFSGTNTPNSHVTFRIYYDD